LSEELHIGRGATPIPDPTLLTTAALTREIAALKDVVFTRLDGMDRAIVLFDANITRVPTETDRAILHLKELLESRLDGMDKAVRLLQDLNDKIPVKIDEKIMALHGVHGEKFDSIQTQFRERDVRSEQSSKDSKVAVDAALQAAKEAVGEQNKSSALAIAKSEASTTKQIDQLGQLIQSTTKGVDDKFQDVKDRLTRIEGKTEGKAGADDRHQTQSNWSVGLIVAVAIGLVGMAISISLAVLHGKP
jgi:hypothetical protein